MAEKSFLNCKHFNTQEYTDYCFDCGYNRNMTNTEYLEQLKQQVRDADPVIKEIRALEKQLGILS